jgi:hypothetical protein
MTHSVFDFSWDVPLKGFHWVDGTSSGVLWNPKTGEIKPLERTHTVWVLTAHPGHRKEYSPFTSATGLFRTFAALPIDDRDAILRFANEYGRLGIRDSETRPSEATEMITECQPGFSKGEGDESLADWARAIRAMRIAVEAWDLITAGDRDALSRYVEWSDKTKSWHDSTRILRWDRSESKWYIDVPRGEFEGSRRRSDVPPRSDEDLSEINPVLNHLPRGDILVAAKLFVQKWVNLFLEKKVNPQLLYDMKDGILYLHIFPDTLLSAMWLQFAQAIDGNHQFRACKECGTWFEISGSDAGFRVNRLFCSDACKSRDYRRRKDRALQLKTEGKTIAAIAKELDTEADTIKKWVAKTRG